MTLPRRRPCWRSLWLGLLGLLVWPAAALASDSLVPLERDLVAEQPKAFAVLPFRVHVAQTATLFQPDAPRAVAADAEALAAVVERTLQRQHQVSVRGVSAVRQRLDELPGAGSQRTVAEQHYRLGLELYLNLSTARSAQALQKAVQIYRGIWQDVVEPRPFADAQFMLGVALVDLERGAEGHLALKDGFLLQPERRFRARFFPPAVEQALTAALIDLQATLDPAHPYGDHARLAQLARALDSRWLVTGVIVQRGADAPLLHLAVYSAQRRTLEGELTLPLSRATDSPDGALDAFFSRLLACVPQQPRLAAPAVKAPALHLETAAAYAPFLRQPTRATFHSAGFAAGAAGSIRESLEWHARMELYTSVADPYRDLLFSFNSLRLRGGVGFGFETGPVHWFLRPGLDLHLLGQFVASTDPDCKLFGRDHPLCDPRTVLDLEQSLLVGINLAGGARVPLGRGFFASLQSSISSYFLPLDGTDRLNFPLSAELGFGYSL